MLVRVHATAITPTELHWVPTFNTPTGQPRAFPIVLSHEMSGVVEEVGAHVSAVKPGDAVYGINDWFCNGAQAEFCIAPASSLAGKPRSLDHVQASVVPISALTAWQALFDRAKVQRGQRVLVHGAAGGVGVFAVQLAESCGAHVFATASSANLQFVRDLGAQMVIDYHKDRFEDVFQDVDVVFDCVGGETLERSWQVLRKGGRLVTIVEQAMTSSPRDRDAFMIVNQDGSQLAVIADLIDRGAIRVFVEGAYPLEQAREAYQRAEHGRMRGKIALRVSD
ncbi:MAG: Alcohol dehydrogenase zinc-binding domain protein [Verrucomicrobiaceae bacterium]|nr:Alcohol dehydrogenase zinc-binding domain protein [Verrucomicrobiaceae bacterium]